ncbi:MAG: hypothetical protein LBL50_03490 [Candidatus Margulisbacteria bacterium]|jgi:hypothetical protein|nr:hypothetical protein [Candidatus Margulisiibacteriota bacterium]
MFIARKNIAARFFSFPRRIFNDLRGIIYTEKIKYCEYLSLRVEKARLIREIKDSERHYADSVPDFERVVGALEWIVNKNTAEALLAAELLRDIARYEMQFRTRGENPTDFMLNFYRKEIIKKILDEGAFAEEKINRLLK